MADRKPHKREATRRTEPSTPRRARGGASAGSTTKMRVVSAGASRGGRNAKASAPRRQLPLKAIAIALAAVVALFIAGAAAIVVLSHTDAFTISSISAEPT